MSTYFLEGVWSPAGVRRTRQEVAAMEDEHERQLLDYELNQMVEDLKPILDEI